MMDDLDQRQPDSFLTCGGRMRFLALGVIQLCLLLLAGPIVEAREIRFETLEAGETVYRDVRVRQVSAKWIVILHAGGVAQIPLAELSPELQVRFGYNAERARKLEEELQRKKEDAAGKALVSARERIAVDRTDRPEPAREIDLRERYFELGLHAKNQGRRPSCSVFAILSVVEFHYSLRERTARFLSEEFLIWATRQVNPQRLDFDGFTFGEVIAALHKFGVVTGSEMPNTLGGPMANIVATGPALENAIGRRDVLIQVALGSNEAKVEEIIRELNEGFPVAVSMRWPPDGVVARVHTLRDQPPRPAGGHAVAIVGYHRPDPASDEILFLFRNSYGLQWGMGGYGYVSDRYLKEHLFDVVGVRLREGRE